MNLFKFEGIAYKILPKLRSILMFQPKNYAANFRNSIVCATSDSLVVFCLDMNFTIRISTNAALASAGTVKRIAFDSDHSYQSSNGRCMQSLHSNLTNSAHAMYTQLYVLTAKLRMNLRLMVNQRKI